MGIVQKAKDEHGGILQYAAAKMVFCFMIALTHPVSAHSAAGEIGRSKLRMRQAYLEKGKF